MKIAFTVEAQQDPMGAAAFDAGQGTTELGAAFIDEIDRACKLPQDAPLMGKPWTAQTWRLVLRRLPFDPVCRIVAEQAQILAVAHQRREPGYWTS